ncbi:hypothetical protein MUP65_02505 [Patescibacteria group bacterium]|nr:hypothetical protein [Patescibacteria group bacterium]
MSPERGRGSYTPDELLAARHSNNGYNGDGIQATEDCPGCQFHLVFNDGELRIKTCEWGVAWKELSNPEKDRRHCAKLHSLSPRGEGVEAQRRLGVKPPRCWGWARIDSNNPTGTPDLYNFFDPEVPLVEPAF